MWKALTVGGLIAVGCAPGEGSEIGPEGGSITVGEVTIDVPEGALDEVVDIAIELDSGVEPDSTGLSDVFSFTPHGLQFIDPVTVTFTHDVGQLPMMKWSDDGRAWSILATGTESTDTQIVAEIEHFSWGYVAEGMDEIVMR